MRGSFFKNSLAFLLAGLLLFGGTAKEALHGWTGHRDTVDTHRKDGAQTIETKHHHCDFLSFFLPPFMAAEPVRAVKPVSLVYGAHQAVPLHLWEARSQCFIAGRGPPRLVVSA